MARKKKRKKTTGMKVATVWMPPPMPLASMTRSQSGAPRVSSRAPKPSTRTPPTRMSKKSMKAAPRFCVKRNIRYITKRKIGRPSQRLSTMRSILSVSVSPGLPLRTTASAAIAPTNS